jgi:hypothetical protein
MSNVLYVLFGTLDGIAILALIFKSFRWPFWRNFGKIALIALVLSVVSYIDRIILDIDPFDPLIQLLLYIILLRYILRVDLYYAWPVAVYGYVFFLFIQLIVYPTLLATGIVSQSDAVSSVGWGTYIIQGGTELACFIVAAIIHFLGQGFNFIDFPPHDEYISVRRSKYDILVNMSGSLAVATFMYFIMNYHGHILIVLPLMAASMAAMVYLARWKDFR